MSVSKPSIEPAIGPPLRPGSGPVPNQPTRPQLPAAWRLPTVLRRPPPAHRHRQHSRPLLLLARLWVRLWALQLVLLPERLRPRPRSRRHHSLRPPRPSRPAARPRPHRQGQERRVVWRPAAVPRTGWRRFRPLDRSPIHSHGSAGNPKRTSSSCHPTRWLRNRNRPGISNRNCRPPTGPNELLRKQRVHRVSSFPPLRPNRLCLHGERLRPIRTSGRPRTPSPHRPMRRRQHLVFQPRHQLIRLRLARRPQALLLSEPSRTPTSGRTRHRRQRLQSARSHLSEPLTRRPIQLKRRECRSRVPARRAVPRRIRFDQGLWSRAV